MEPTQNHRKLSTTSRRASASAWSSASTRSSLPAPARHVALTIVLRANDENSARCLARRTGLSERSVRAHHRTLREHGRLTVAEEGGWRTETSDRGEVIVRRSTIYALALPPATKKP